MKPGLYTNMVALETLLRKEVLRFLRIWTQTLLPPAITMTLYFIIFGKFIGSQIKPLNGFSYIQYIVPGLVMMSIITNAYANTSSSFFFTKFNKSIEEILVSPMSNLVTLLGFMLSGAFRGILVGVMVTLVALFFTHLPIYNLSIVSMMAILSAMVFSLGGLINAIYAKRFDDISFIPTFVLTPLTYLGGVFYSVNQLPSPWRTISLGNPILAMVDSFRYGLLGISDLNIYVGFGMVSILLIGMFFWAFALLHNGTGIKM